MTYKTLVLSMVAVAVVLLSGGLATADSLAERLEKGIYTEETVGDLDAARDIYQQIVADAKADHFVAARAQFRLGQCFLLLGSSSFGKFARISGDGDSRSWTDWYYLQAGTNLASWSVRPDSPYKTFADVIAAAKANPGQITISTSGTGGLWHEMAASVAQAAGIELKYVPYSGGQTATLAGLNGEVDIAGGGVHEHMQFVDAGQLVTLQQTSAEDIVTPDGNVMPSLVNFIPEIKDLLPPNGTYDIGIRRDTPIEILRELQRAFLAAVNSQHFIDVMERRNFVVDVLVNEEADRRAAQLEVISADTFEKLNIPGARTAEQLNLPEPEDFDTWWPPEGYEPLPL